MEIEIGERLLNGIGLWAAVWLGVRVITGVLQPLIRGGFKIEMKD